MIGIECDDHIHLFTEAFHIARDMTEGNIPRTLTAFSIPLILSGLLQQLYNWADALIIGNFAGEAQLSAIGAVVPASMLFIAILSGFSTGVSIQISNSFGRGDRAAVRWVTTVFFGLSLIGALMMTALGLLFIEPLMRALNIPLDIAGYSRGYLSVTMWGIPALAIYNHYSAVLRGIGDSRTPLIAITMSSVLNVALDGLFVIRWQMGAYGTAISTVIAQVALAVFIMAFASAKYPMLRLARPSGEGRGLLRAGLKLSLPTAMQFGIRSAGGLMLQNIMNGFGSQVIAGISSAYRVDSIALLPVVNLSSGISTFTAQNAGAGNRGRARQGLRVGLIMSAVVSVGIAAAIVPLSGRLIGLFGVSPGAIEIGSELILILAMVYPVFGIMNALIGHLQGLGDTVFTSIASIAALALRIALSYLLMPMLGRRVIAVAELISWLALAVACIARTIRMNRR